MMNRWARRVAILSGVALTVLAGSEEADAKPVAGKVPKASTKKGGAKKRSAKATRPSVAAVSASEATVPERVEPKPVEKTAEKPAEKPPEKVTPSASGGVSMVDCTVRANDDKDVKCVAAQAGTVGSGPKLTGGLTTEVRHGFVSGNRLIVAVELSGSSDEYGGIFGVDLTTGARTLLSGKMNDPVEGEVTKGNGPPGKTLNQVRDVTQGPNGTWIAIASNGLQSPRTIFSINPANGDRSVLFDAFTTPCAGISGKDVSFDYAAGIAAGPDGAVYVALNNLPQGTGKGIAKVQGVHPNGKHLIVNYANALHLYDPATGNSNTLSY